MMTRYQRAIRFGIPSFIALSLVLSFGLSYYSFLNAVAHKVGLIEDIAIDGVRLHMRPGWYQNFPRRDHVTRQTEHGTVSLTMTSVLMEKIVGLTVESSFMVVRLTPELIAQKNLDRFRDRRMEFPWGHAIILDGTFFKSEKSDYGIFILPQRLYIKTKNPDVVKEIDHITIEAE